METSTQTSACGCGKKRSQQSPQHQDDHLLRPSPSKSEGAGSNQSNISSSSISLTGLNIQDDALEIFFTTSESSSPSETTGKRHSSDEGREHFVGEHVSDVHTKSSAVQGSRTDFESRKQESVITVPYECTREAWNECTPHHLVSQTGLEFRSFRRKVFSGQNHHAISGRSWNQPHLGNMNVSRAASDLVTCSADLNFIRSSWGPRSRSDTWQQRGASGRGIHWQQKALIATSRSTRSRGYHKTVPLKRPTGSTERESSTYFGRSCEACAHQLRQQWAKSQQIHDYDSGSPQKQGLYVLPLGKPVADGTGAQQIISKVSMSEHGLPRLTDLKNELADPHYYDEHREDLVESPQAEKEWVRNKILSQTSEAEMQESIEEISETNEISEQNEEDTELKTKSTVGKSQKATKERRSRLHAQDTSAGEGLEKQKATSRKMVRTPKARAVGEDHEEEKDMEQKQGKMAEARRKSSVVSKRPSPRISRDEGEQSDKKRKDRVAKTQGKAASQEEDTAVDRKQKMPKKVITKVDSKTPAKDRGMTRMVSAGHAGSAEAIKSETLEPELYEVNYEECVDVTASVKEDSAKDGYLLPSDGYEDRKQETEELDSGPEKERLDTVAEPSEEIIKGESAQDVIAPQTSPELLKSYSDHDKKEADSVSQKSEKLGEGALELERAPSTEKIPSTSSEQESLSESSKTNVQGEEKAVRRGSWPLDTTVRRGSDKTEPQDTVVRRGSWPQDTTVRRGIYRTEPQDTAVRRASWPQDTAVRRGPLPQERVFKRESDSTGQEDKSFRRESWPQDKGFWRGSGRMGPEDTAFTRGSWPLDTTFWRGSDRTGPMKMATVDHAELQQIPSFDTLFHSADSRIKSGSKLADITVSHLEEELVKDSEVLQEFGEKPVQVPQQSEEESVQESIVSQQEKPLQGYAVTQQSILKPTQLSYGGQLLSGEEMRYFQREDGRVPGKEELIKVMATAHENLTPAAQAMLIKYRRSVTQHQKYKVLIRSHKSARPSATQKALFVKGEHVKCPVETPQGRAATESHVDKKSLLPFPRDQPQRLQSSTLSPVITPILKTQEKKTKQETTTQNELLNWKFIQECMASSRDLRKPEDMTGRAIHGKALDSLLHARPVATGLAVPFSAEEAEDSCHMASHALLQKVARDDAWEDGMPRVLAPFEVRWRRIPPRLGHPLWYSIVQPVQPTETSYSGGMGGFYLQAKHPHLLQKDEPLHQQIRKEQLFGRPTAPASEHLQPYVTTLFPRGQTISAPHPRSFAEEQDIPHSPTLPLQSPRIPSAGQCVPMQKDISRHVLEQEEMKEPLQTDIPPLVLEQEHLKEPLKKDIPPLVLEQERMKESLSTEQVQHDQHARKQPQVPIHKAPIPPCLTTRNIPFKDEENLTPFPTGQISPPFSKCPYFRRVNRNTKDGIPRTLFEDTTKIQVSPSAGVVKSSRTRQRLGLGWLGHPQDIVSSIIPKPPHGSSVRDKNGQDSKLHKLVMASSVRRKGPRDTPEKDKVPSFYIGSPYDRDRFFFGEKRSMITLDVKEAELLSFEHMKQREPSAHLVRPRVAVPRRPQSVIKDPQMLEHLREGRQLMKTSQVKAEMLQDYNLLMDRILQYEIPGMKSMKGDYTALVNRPEKGLLDNTMQQSGTASNTNHNSIHFPPVHL